MLKSPVILYLDRYHLGDDLFLRAFARALGERGNGPPLLVCHGSGDDVERLFESKGLFPERIGGRIETVDAQERALLERGMRETGRKLTALLTNAIVSSVALSGSDRGLLAVSEGDGVRSGDASMVHALLEKRVVPVVSTLAREEGDGGGIDAAPADALAALLGAISASGVAFFARGGRISEPEGTEARTGAVFEAEGGADLLTEPDVARNLRRRGIVTYLVTPVSLQLETPENWARVSVVG